MQADMWDGSLLNGFDPIVQRIADRSAAFGRPVLLLQGDSHVFTVDTPLAAGSPTHGVATAAPNVTRIVVDGAATAREWLKVTVDPSSTEDLSLRRIRQSPEPATAVDDEALAGDETRRLGREEAQSVIIGYYFSAKT